MRIGIDARLYNQAGIGRYISELIKGLEKIDNKNDYIIFLYKDAFEAWQPSNPHFQKILAPYLWYTPAEQIYFPLQLYKYKLDLMHFPHFNVPFFYKRKFIVTIHDLLLFKFKTTHASTKHPLIFWLKYIGYKFIIKNAIIQSHKIIAVSEYTKNAILQYFKIPQQKITTIYEGVYQLSPSRPPNPKNHDILSKYNLKKPYFLYVGSAYPHKNLDMLVGVFKDLIATNPNLQLILVGNIDFFYKKLYNKIKELNLVKNIILTNKVSDIELSALYQNAYAYISASLYEGFGLPQLEALSNDTPVLSSNAAALPEILGNSALFFNPQNKENILAAIQTIQQQPELRTELIQKGRLWIKQYNSETMVQKTYDYYQHTD